VPGAAVTWTCVDVIAGAVGLLTVSTNAVAAEDCPNESLTVSVKLTVAFEVGVPETMPVPAASDNPSAGRPVALHVSAPVPLAWKVKPYTEAAVPGAAVTCVWVVVIVGGAGLLTVMTSSVDADFAPAVLESVTVTVKLTVPLAVGVPVIAPVVELIESPLAGRPTALHVRVPAPPAAANAKL
jgi:hypothetical protein